MAGGAAPAVLKVGTADVGINRERLRRQRLRAIAVVLALPLAFLWYRLLVGRPFNVLSVPSIDPVVLVEIVFFIVLIGVLAGQTLLVGRSPHVIFRPEQLDVRLSDVVGIDMVRNEVVRSLNLFLSNKDFSENLGGRPRRGVLFEGAPGTGKTHTAKALAAEAGVPFLFASATSFHSSWQGGTQRKIRSYFRKLRSLARKEGGAIGFIDEFDGIGGARGGGSAATPLASRAWGGSALGAASFGTAMSCGGLEGLPSVSAGQTLGVTTTPFAGSNDVGMGVNELLVQMQSFDDPSGSRKFVSGLVSKLNLLLPLGSQIPAPREPYSNVLLIASTNRADSLDPALMRPGRFDQRLTFELPTKASRRELIDYFLGLKAHDSELDQTERRDALAAITQEYSPAMLERLLDDALIHALEDGRRAAGWADVEHARMVMEVGLGQPVMYTDYEERLIATHESGHATVAWLVAPERRLEVLTIVKRRQALGLLAHGDREDVYTRGRSEMLALMQIAFGGQVAEELFFGDVSTGPGGDLLYATTLAAQMVGAVGMADSLVSFGAIQGSTLTDTNLVGRVLADGDGRRRVEDLMQQQKARAHSLIDANRHLVEALRDALLERHELIGREITDILEAAQASGPRPSTIDLTDGARDSQRPGSFA